MKIDFKKTYDNAKRNLTKQSIARSITRTRQQVLNYYKSISVMPNDVNEAIIKIFEENGDEVYYLEQ